MTTLALALATALMLGALHAFDADHLAALTSFVARRPSPRAAAGFAVRWGLGHSLTLLLVGLLSALFDLIVPARVEPWAELAVGVTLVGLGLWVLAGTRRGRLLHVEHAHGDLSHAHLHRRAHQGAGSGSVFWVGVLHGLAGSAGLMVLIPVVMMSSAWTILGYTLAFSIGVTGTMTAYAVTIGGLIGTVGGGAAARWYPWLAGAAGSCTVLVGFARITRTLVTLGA